MPRAYPAQVYDLVEAQRSPVATEAVRRIGELYAIEREIRGRSPDLRRQVRQARSRPLLDAMKNWMQGTLGQICRKSDVATASQAPARSSIVPA